MTPRFANSAAHGRWGEEQACRFLEERGFKIYQRNFRTPRAEVDIIAGDGDILCFCEVKTWVDVPRDELARAIGQTKRRRIISAARAWLGSHREFQGHEIRFDVVFMQGPQAIPEHIAGAFDASM